MEPTEEMLGPRDVVVVRGADAASYLHSQLTQSIAPMAVGEHRWSFVLEPGGKAVALFGVRRTADDVFELDTDAGFGDLLAERIERFKIRVDATVERAHRPGVADEPARIEAGWPRMGAEIVPGETIVGGTGLTRVAVDFTKGCYPGQELVERMDSRSAGAPRTLRRLEVGAHAAVGDPVLDGDDEVGVLTSVAAGRAIAWVKRSSTAGEPIDW